MAFALTPLPYADTALEPAISAHTLSFHHAKHHQAYVDKMNAAIEGTELDGKPMSEVIAAIRVYSTMPLKAGIMHSTGIR